MFMLRFINLSTNESLFLFSCARAVCMHLWVHKVSSCVNGHKGPLTAIYLGNAMRK